MFGGWGIYRGPQMIAIVYDGRAYMKTTSESQRMRFQDAGMGPFQPRPRQTLKSFWEIPPDVLESAAATRSWIAALRIAPAPS